MKQLLLMTAGLVGLFIFACTPGVVAQTAGSASPNQTICAGTTPGPLTLSGFSGSVQWQVFTIQSGAWMNISSAGGSTLGSAQMGVLNETTFYRAAVSEGGNTVYSNMISITVNPTGEAQAPVIGNGTTVPFQISSFAHLRWIAADSARWSYHYKQTANINATVTGDVCYHDPSGWNPIGNGVTPFTGSYDGGNYRITGLSMNRTGSFRGLFGEALDATLSNIRLENVNIAADHGVGALVGKASGVTITNCHSKGIISVAESGSGWSSTGGLVGDMYASATNPGIIQNCSSTANITGFKSGVGGLVGVLGGEGACYIYESFATGNVSVVQSGGMHAGGLVGLVVDHSVIENSFATGSVSANEYSGGLVGTLTGSIIHSYALGTVSGFSAGGLVGGTSDTTTVTGSLWNTQTSGITGSAGGVGVSATELKDPEFLINAGWDFQCESANGDNDVWGQNDSAHNGYPFLSWQNFEHDNKIFTGEIFGEQLLCEMAQPAPVYISGAVGDIQWQSSNDNSLFMDIDGASGDTLHLPLPDQMGSTWYRAILSNGSCSEISDVVQVAVAEPTSSLIDTVACDSVVINEMVYDSTGQYIQHLTNQAGCDSTLTINLTITSSTASEVSVVACESYEFNGQIYSESGLYEQVLVNAMGCDSVVTLNLSILESSSHTIYQTACNSYMAPNGEIITESGSFDLVYTNSVGCDSIVTHEITIEQTNTIVETSATMATLGFSNGSATVSVTGDLGPFSYQWNDPFMQTTATAWGLFPGSYVCTVTDSSGCQTQVQVEVPLVTGVPDTKLSTVFCDSTGFILSDIIYCDNVHQAELYVWEFNGPDGEVLEYTRYNSRYLRLQWVTGLEFGKTYYVRVKARVDGQWGEYDEVCAITTAAVIPTTEVSQQYHPTNSVGQPYTMCDLMRADKIHGAAAYRWKFDPDQEENGNEIFYQRNNSNPTVLLYWVNSLIPGTTYYVSVDVKVGSDWSGFGNAHAVLFDEVPAVRLRNMYCGNTFTTQQNIMSESVCEADFYQFQFVPVDGGETRYITSAGYVAMLRYVSPALTPGDYEVRVRVKQGGVLGEYAEPCLITITPDGMQAEDMNEMVQKRELELVPAIGIYPNPVRGEEFRISLTDLPDQAQSVQIRMLDLKGQEVHSESVACQGGVVNHRVVFNQKPASGVYVIDVSVGAEIRITKKLILH